MSEIVLADDPPNCKLCFILLFMICAVSVLLVTYNNNSKYLVVRIVTYTMKRGYYYIKYLL